MPRSITRPSSRTGDLHHTLIRLLLLLLFAPAACDRFPRDMEGTLDRVTGGMMIVGVIHHPPFASTRTMPPQGVEVDLIRNFADQLNADIEWVTDDESSLFQAMGYRELDVLIGGITDATPFSRHIAMSQPYLTTRWQVAAGPEAPRVDRIAGHEVAAEPNSAMAGLLRARDAAPVERPRSELAEYPGLIVAADWQREAWGHVPLEVVLRTDRHIIAVPQGENAFLRAIDAYLHTAELQVRERLVQEAATISAH